MLGRILILNRNKNSFSSRSIYYSAFSIIAKKQKSKILFPPSVADQDVSAMPEVASTRAASRWSTRIIPLFLGASVGYATYVVVALVCGK